MLHLVGGCGLQNPEGSNQEKTGVSSYQGEKCPSCYSSVFHFTTKGQASYHYTNWYRRARFRFIHRYTPWLIPIFRKKSKTKKGTGMGMEPRGPVTNPDLEPGDWVEVLSEMEIAATLDGKGRSGGLYFMPEMKQFCGKRYKVFKRVERIILESTGELRQIKTPTYFLEGVYCDGKLHSGCDKSCFLLWRGGWLRKSSPPANQ